VSVLWLPLEADVPERQESRSPWTTAFLSSGGEPLSPPGRERSAAKQAESAKPEPAGDSTKLTIPGNLDHSIGDISHAGPVHIKGHVGPGLHVFAAGMLRVDGDVRGARLIAGGAIHVRGSVDGRGESQIDAIGDITVGSARLATLTAGGDVRARYALVRCTIHAFGRVVLTHGFGQISGGEIHAGGGLSVLRLGSSTGRSTIIHAGEVVVGDDAESLEKRLALCNMAAKRTTSRMDELCALFAALPEGRAAAVQDIRRLIQERARTLRLRTSLVRRQRQAGSPRVLPDVLVEAKTVLPEVTIDTGDGPRPLGSASEPPHGDALV
jgi:Flagellar Assembly Protein A beta solenoid domain